MPSLKNRHRDCFLSFPFLSKGNFYSTHTHPSLPRTRLKCLSFGDSAADLGTTLTGGEAGRLSGNNVRSLLDNFVGLGEDELDVARVGHVGVDLR